MPGSDNVSMTMRSQDSAVNDEASGRMAAIIEPSEESIPEHRVRVVGFKLIMKNSPLSFS